jgi:hypothetical protein
MDSTNHAESTNQPTKPEIKPKCTWPGYVFGNQANMQVYNIPKMGPKVGAEQQPWEYNGLCVYIYTRINM